MKMTNAYLSLKRTERLQRLGGIVRPDISSSDLRTWESQGYSQVVFVANYAADPECTSLNGNIYEIRDLNGYDNPLFRTSHPNCNCEFTPYEPSKR